MFPQLAVLGFSQEAELVDNATRDEFLDLQSSNAIGVEPVLEELSAVWQECQTQGWDGFDAVPVSEESLNITWLLLESLPLGFPLPTVGAEPDGQLTLEWHQSPSCTFSVSVDPDGLLHYAGLFGPNRRFGTEVFYGELPEIIQRFVEEIRG